MPSVLRLQVLTRAEHGTENTASCMEQQIDECCSKAENQQGHRVSGSQFEWKGEAMWQEWTNADGHSLHQCGT